MKLAHAKSYHTTSNDQHSEYQVEPTTSYRLFYWSELWRFPGHSSLSRTSVLTGYRASNAVVGGSESSIQPAFATGLVALCSAANTAGNPFHNLTQRQL